MNEPSSLRPLRRGRTPRLGEEELRRIEEELTQALSEIRFGSIEIIIQDSRVVQIERREKVRFDRSPGPTGAPR